MTESPSFSEIVTGLTIVLICTAACAESFTVRGRVLDDQGRPVENATVAPFWSANGPARRPDGRPLDYENPDDLRFLWSREGQMAARKPQATTDAAGRFEIEMVSPIKAHTLLAMNQKRDRGAIAFIPMDPAKSDVELRLTTLTRVSGRFSGGTSGKEPEWTNVYFRVPFDPRWPTSSCRIVQCGSFESRFEVLLPPGKYEMVADGVSSLADDDLDLVLKQPPPITVTVGQESIDLGVLTLSSAPPSHASLASREAAAKQAGRWNDLESLYGKIAPPWQISDARGLDKSTRLEDLRGRSVLLYFWNLHCRSCIGISIPKLMAIHERSAANERQLEIITVYVDWHEETATLSDLEKQMEPYEERVWGGRTLPFPILLDDSRRTSERYGAAGAGISVLIGPDGKVVRGGTDFHEVLNGSAEQSDPTDGEL